MNAFIIYLITRLDVLKAISVLILTLAAIGAAVFIFFAAISCADGDGFCLDGESFNHALLRKIPFKFIWTMIPFILILIFVPSTAEMTAMYIIPKVVNSKEIQQLPPVILNYIKKQMADKE